MKVKEVIEALQKLNPDAYVIDSITLKHVNLVKKKKSFNQKTGHVEDSEELVIIIHDESWES